MHADAANADGIGDAAQRRHAIAEIVRKHDAYLLEDDAYGYLLSPPLAPISRSIPERSFYIVSFAKCLAPGLRIAAMIAPEAFRDRSINALRATGWMAVPVMAEVVARLIQNGGLARQAKLKRDKAAHSRRHRAPDPEGVAAASDRRRPAFISGCRCPPAARWRR